MMARYGMTRNEVSRMAGVGTEQFINDIWKYDLGPSGGETDVLGRLLVTEEKISHMKQSCLTVDAGPSFERTEYQTLSNPVATIQGRKYLLANTAQSHLFSDASKMISRVFSNIVLQRSIIRLEPHGFLNGSVE